jgi:uncharacterized membrane protein YqhA
MKRLERVLERLLWSSRLIMLVGVAAGLVLALAAVFLGLVDTVSVFRAAASFGPNLSETERAVVRGHVVTYIVKAIDSYLIAAIMVIFAVGLYELFVRRIELPENADFDPRELRVKSLEDLKNRIMRLVLLVLIVEFFQHALGMTYERPLDLFYLAIAILLIGGAFWLTHQHKSQE